MTLQLFGQQATETGLCLVLAHQLAAESKTHDIHQKYFFTCLAVFIFNQTLQIAITVYLRRSPFFGIAHSSIASCVSFEYGVVS